MTVELGIIISIASLGIAFSSFMFARKKENKTDGFDLGQFVGEMRSELGNIKQLINELKQDNKEVDERIAKAIIEHEVRFHNK